MSDKFQWNIYTPKKIASGTEHRKDKQNVCARNIFSKNLFGNLIREANSIKMAWDNKFKI